MGSSSFLAPAVKCVEALQVTPIARERLFEDPRNVALASAISMLSYTAQYVDHMVKGNNKLHNIGIFVACRAQESTGTTPTPTFMLWNSISEPEKPTISPSAHLSSGEKQEIADTDERSVHLQDLDQSSLRPSMISQHSVPSQKNESDHILDGAPQSARDAQAEKDLHPRNQQQPCQEQSQPQQLQQAQQSQTQQPHQETGRIPNTLGRSKPSPDEDPYTVPVRVAAKCLELLLDGSGYTAHRHIFQKRSFTELSTKLLVDALKQVFKAEQEQRSSNKAPSVPKPIGNKDDMIYCDLLPDTLRSCNTAQGVIVRVPEIVLEESGSVTVPKYMKVPMNIRKPDRNKKDQNFAVLCALLDHTGPTGVCAKILREFASKGFTYKGCKRRKQYSTSSKSSCVSSREFCRNSRALCSFSTTGGGDEIGKGSVNPYATEHNGKKLESSTIVARLETVKEFENIGFSDDLTLEQKKSMYGVWRSGVPVVWPRTCIQRIELLGDFNKPIGTAIFVQQLFLTDAHQSILRRIRKSARKRSTLDLSNAVIVCDFVLKESSKATLPVYPYMEWYNLPCFKPLKELHFGEDSPPKKLTDPSIRSARALLWNKTQCQTIKER